jgi:hypothetical protein
MPPKDVLFESKGFTILAVLITCYKRLKITTLRFLGKIVGSTVVKNY